MKKFGVIVGFVVIGLVGCNMVGGNATAVAPAEIPEGWSKHGVGGKMSLVLPPYLQTDTIPKDSILSMLADASGGGDTLMRTYIGPDVMGRDCMVMLMAVHGPAGSTNPEGAVNEVVDMMSGMGMAMTDVTTSKRKVDLPIGPAWRGVITMTMGGEAISTIVYAGVASGRYYQVQFTESGAGDVVLVEDEAIMQTVRFD